MRKKRKKRKKSLFAKEQGATSAGSDNRGVYGQRDDLAASQSPNQSVAVLNSGCSVAGKRNGGQHKEIVARPAEESRLPSPTRQEHSRVLHRLLPMLNLNVGRAPRLKQFQASSEMRCWKSSVPLAWVFMALQDSNGCDDLVSEIALFRATENLHQAAHH
jgi:hypothetical protein